MGSDGAHPLPDRLLTIGSLSKFAPFFPLYISLWLLSSFRALVASLDLAARSNGDGKGEEGEGGHPPRRLRPCRPSLHAGPESGSPQCRSLRSPCTGKPHARKLHRTACIKLEEYETAKTALEALDSARNFFIDIARQLLNPEKPSYPSYKSKVDWDKLGEQVKKEDKEEKLDDDAELNKFFREIYKDGDDNLRRAMSKSFGWSGVGSKKVECTPPDGMEMKKWEY